MTAARVFSLLLLLLVSASCSRTENAATVQRRGGEVTYQRGDIVSVELRGSLTAEQIDNQILGSAQDPALNGIEIYHIIYATVDPHGRLTVASGALALPDSIDSPLPLLSYQHGTVVQRENVPSRRGSDLSALLFGGGGYAVAIPDYLGLGDSPGFHPYIHARSLGTSVIDMLRAVRTYCRQRSIPLRDSIFLAGYSEGGYATMAAHKLIEEEYAAEFPVAASAPMAGPYDLSGSMRQLFTGEGRGADDESYSQPFYLPYVVLAYNDVYRFADSLSEIFRPEYARILPDLFDGRKEGYEINFSIPAIPKKIFSQEFLRQFTTDSAHPLRRALLENDLFRWSPQAPMRIVHCREDDQVPYQNARVAYESFRGRGVTNVELVTLDAGGHGSCMVPSIIAVKNWFDSMRADRGRP